jgi:FHS family glucose/mannose:H+ symporter-like MFS transporter
MSDSSRLTRSRSRRLTASAFAGMFVFGIVMAVLGAILPSLFHRLDLEKGQAGSLFLYMNFAMLVMSVIFGPVVDRFGFKLFLVFSALLVAAAFALLAGASSYGLVVLAAAVLGFGGGGLNGGTNALTSDVNPSGRGSALNLLGIFFGFGALSIPFLIGTLVGWAGLKNILLLAAALSLVPLVLFTASVFPKPKQPQGFFLKRAAGIMPDPALWLCAFILFFESGNEFTVGGWVSTYLQEDFGAAAVTASLALAGYWAAIMAGRLAASGLVSRLKSEKLLMGSATLALLGTVLLAAAPGRTTALLAALVVGLGFASIYPTTLAIAGERFATLSGTAFSVIFTVALSGGMLSPWLAGKIAQASGLRRGLFIPVVNCSMIIILLVVLRRVLRVRRLPAPPGQSEGRTPEAEI